MDKGFLSLRPEKSEIQNLCQFIDFYLILLLCFIHQVNKEMIQAQKREIFIRHQNKDKYLIRVSQQGVYQLKEHGKGNQKKLFPMNINVRVRLTETKMVQNKYNFVVKIGDKNSYVLGLIEGKQQLQKFLKVIGFYIPINGLQQIVVIFKKTGEGAFAQVYQIVTSYQHRYAVKSFQKKLLQKCQKTNKAFNNQIELMKKTNSLYIIPFQYIFETDKAYYLKMEFLSKTLKQKISSKLLVKEQKTIMKQLMLALLEMKKKNIIHRDLKPQNIMIRTNQRGEEQCVVIDLGLATIADANPYIYVRCGTPGFLAPEIANQGEKSQKQTCSADMFSLGCIFYKVLTGHYLFPGKTAKEVLQTNRKCQYSAHAFQKLSIDQKRLLIRMLDIDPNKRIKPQEALQDPYFQQNIDDQDQIPQQQCKIDEKVKKISINLAMKNMDSIKSWNSIKSITSQAYRQIRRSEMKDSCLTFQLKSNQIDNQSSLRRSPLSKSTNIQRSGLSPKKSRFSKLQDNHLL